MATTISRPDGTVSAGNWSVVDADIPGVLNDADDATIVFNTNANQTMTLTLDMDVSNISLLKSLQPVIRVRRGGKGSASFTVTIDDGSQTFINAEAFSTTSATLVTLTGTAEDVSSIGAGQTQANNLRVTITGTSSTQGFFADFSLIVEYDTVSVAGTITLNSGTIILNSGTITL